MPDIKYHRQADQNDKNCKGGSTSINSAPGEIRAVASFPKIPAQILPKHKPHCFWGESSEDDTGTEIFGTTHNLMYIKARLDGALEHPGTVEDGRWWNRVPFNPNLSGILN